MKQLSRRMKDQPQSPMERAVFWIEYVIRNNGSQFLSPKSRSLSLFVSSCNDIHFFLLTVTCLLFYLLYFIIKVVVNVQTTKTKKD